MTWNIRRSALPNDRRFTLPSTIQAVKNLVKIEEFSLDVAAEPLSHHAEKWIGPLGEPGQGGCVGLDGMVAAWSGHVFCNPPWSQKDEWVAKAWSEWSSGLPNTITMLLPATTDQAWWHTFVEPHRISGALGVRFMETRTKYGKPEDPTGKDQGSPQFGSVILHWSCVTPRDAHAGLSMNHAAW